MVNFSRCLGLLISIHASFLLARSSFFLDLDYTIGSTNIIYWEDQLFSKEFQEIFAWRRFSCWSLFWYWNQEVSSSLINLLEMNGMCFQQSNLLLEDYICYSLWIKFWNTLTLKSLMQLRFLTRSWRQRVTWVTSYTIQ